METNELNKLIDISYLPFNGIEWDDEKYKQLDDYLADIETLTLEEIDKNLIGKTILEKNDVIRKYVSNIEEIKSNILSVIFDDDDADDADDADDDERDIYAVNKLALDKIKLCFQNIIDGICILSYQYNINLIKIIEDNPVTCNKFNLSVYYEKIKESLIKKGSKSNLLTANILTPEGLALFQYLMTNFDSKYSPHNKFSCLFRLMSKDGHFSKDLKPEQFKSILKASPYNVDIKFSLLTESQISSKILKHYELLKKLFYQSA